MPFEPGDLLLFYGRDFSSRVIEWATRGPSHVGIVCPHRLAGGGPRVIGDERRETLAPHPGPPPWTGGGGPDGDRDAESNDESRPLLFESTTLCDEPCVLTGRCLQGVQAHEPAERIASYRGAVARLRLTRAWRFNSHEIDILHDWLMHVANEPYDLRGALVSGTRLFK